MYFSVHDCPHPGVMNSFALTLSQSSTLTLWKASLAESCKFLKHLVLISV